MRIKDNLKIQIAQSFNDWLSQQSEELSLFLELELDKEAELSLSLPLFTRPTLVPSHLQSACAITVPRYNCPSPVAQVEALEKGDQERVKEPPLPISFVEDDLILIKRHQLLTLMLKVIKQERQLRESQLSERTRQRHRSQRKRKQHLSELGNPSAGAGAGAGGSVNNSSGYSRGQSPTSSSSADKLWLVYLLISKGISSSTQMTHELDWPASTVRFYRDRLLKATLICLLKERYGSGGEEVSGQRLFDK